MFARSSHAFSALRVSQHPVAVAMAAFAFVGATALTGCSSSGGDAAPGTDTGTTKDSSTGGDASGDTSVVPDGGSDTKSDSAIKTDSATKDGGDSGGPTITTCDGHTGDACNMVLQNCAADETCDYSPSLGHNACTKPPIGVVGKGEACDASNPCDRGLFCYDNKCSPPCCPGDNSVCGGEGKCNLSITEPSDGGADKVLYHVCTYPAVCHPFKFDCPTNQVCLFATEPDSFSCATPTSSAAYKAGPGGKCTYANDCGESQICTELSTGGDAGSGSKCYLFCWLTPPTTDAGTPATGGRFAANGSCTVGGTNYGTCTSITGIGGGLGLCVK
jgi:hypothetical protein